MNTRRTFLRNLSGLALTAPLMAADTRGALRWLRRSAAVVVHPLLYGLGQGLLIFALLTSDASAAGTILRERGFNLQRTRKHLLDALEQNARATDAESTST